MKTISETGLSLIKQYEGFSESVYTCSAGKRTIGYGHVIMEEENFPESITQAQAEILLRKDVAIAENAVNRWVEADISQNQFDALVSFVFNVGEGAFEKSTLLRCINAGLMAEAVRQFHRWVYAKGVKLPGLANRRAVEAALFAKNITY